MDLTELSKDIYGDNKAKGFWDDERNVGEMLMLVVSELGEAMEALRKGKECDTVAVNNIHMSPVLSGVPQLDENFKSNYKDYIKGTFEEEIADSVIRLLDLCGGLSIDIQKHVELKLAYNKMRPYKHGKKF